MNKSDGLIQPDFNNKVMEKRLELYELLERFKEVEREIETLYDEQLDKVRGMYND